MATTLDDFQAHRSTLLGLAYRLLGSMWDAEDVVQDAYVRWSSSGRADVRDPRAYLMTTVKHLATAAGSAARETPRDPQVDERTDAGHVPVHAQGGDPAQQAVYWFGGT